MILARSTGLVAAAALAAATLQAAPVQAPHAAWRTLATDHYRIHYPPFLSDWAQDVGGRIEGIHREVVALVGYESPRPVQVVLLDPMALPNGMAVPLLGNPYVVLWRTEPRSDDVHGSALSGWTDLLMSHELTHIHHLLRPSRPPTAFTRLFGLPIGPLALKCPRWVSEGYATLAEGRITGSGRPHSVMRAAVLRQWARLGKLPRYEELDALHGFQGGSMAYLVGSAYLEWLERQRPGQPVLQRFWKHLASRRGRSFDAAFLATFGFAARDGYQRFAAEAGHDALELEARLRALGLREGELLLRTDGVLRDLAVSPDGTRLAAALETGARPGLRVWPLAAPATPPKPVKPARPDPLNAVEDVAPDCPVREPAATLPRLDHQVPFQPRWLDDRRISFQLRRRDAEGSLRPEPALWNLDAGVTLRPGPLPVPALRTLEPVNRDGLWRLDLEGHAVPLPGQPVGRAVLDEAHGQVFAACEVDGVWNLVRVPFTREAGAPRFGAAQVLTRTLGGAWNPAPAPDGRSLYFTTLDPRGMEVRKLDLGLPPLAGAAAPEARLVTDRTVLPAALEPRTLPRTEGPLPTRPYRAAANAWLQVSSGMTLGPAGSSYQLGLASTDLLGRLSWQVLAGFGEHGGPRGAMAGVSSAAWAWKPSLVLFSADERPSEQRLAPAAGDRRRRGAEGSALWEDRGELPVWISPVIAVERMEARDGGDAATRSLAGLRAGLRALWARGGWGLRLAPDLQAYGGRTSGAMADRWTLVRGDLALRLETPQAPLTLTASAGRTGSRDGASLPSRFHLGGLTTSLVPESLDCDRVEQPALPARLAVGDRFFRWRAEAGGLVSAYLEGTRVWFQGDPLPPFVRVAGVRLALDNPLGLASDAALRRTRLELGVHRGLDGIMKDRTVATVALVVRP